jgi:Holliday junction resolvase RusA-like endonuclease
MELRFDVIGTPVTQGSMERSRYGKTYHRNGQTLTLWRRRVAAEALASLKPSERKALPLTGPMTLICHFTLAQPKSNRDDFPISQRSGDGDKYLRAIGDALTQGGIIQDDSLLVDKWVRKRYIGKQGGGDMPGVSIHLAQITDDNPQAE